MRNFPILPAGHPAAVALDPAVAVDFDRVTRVARRALNAPVAQFNVVTSAEQISASSAGPGPWRDRRSVGLDASYCQHVVRTGEALLIDDARTHPLVRENRATTEAGIGAYAGVPVILADGTVAGTLCVVDFVPRRWTAEERALLDDLAAAVAGRLELTRHSAEHARARDYLDHVLSASAAYLYVLSLDGERIAQHWASANVEQITGYAVADVLTAGWWHAGVHPEDRDGASAAIGTARARGAAVHEYRFRHRAGHYVWVHDELRLVRDTAGNPVEIVGSWVDITARKAAEAALRTAHEELEGRVRERTAELSRANAELRREAERRRESEAALQRSAARFRSLIEHAPDVISLVDAAGIVTYQSPSVAGGLGYGADALVGGSMYDWLHPDDRGRAGAVFARALREPGQSHGVTVRFRHADGSWRVFEALVRNRLADPAVAAVVFNARDVTDRAAAEERFRATFEQAAVGIATVAPDGRWLRVNARLCAIVGYEEAELQQLTYRDITHAEDVQVDGGERARLLKGEIGSYQTVKRYVHKGGHIVWAFLTTSVVRDTNGAPDYVIAVIEDISERRRTAEELRLAKFEVLERLAQASEFRDDDTGQHTRRVGELSADIAEALGLPPEEVELIRRAAPLHDVGKIGIPDSILLKPGRLTPDEYELMKTHARIGAQLLSGGTSQLMSTAEVIARAHHERWDGSGYPEGHAGAAIPLSARIVAVADFYDALTSDRPYRRAWPRAKVLAEIERSAGTHFDPDVVRVFLGLADRCLTTGPRRDLRPADAMA
jgi:putative two-component system response regulator